MVEPGWTTADYALIVSVCSAVVSVSGFVWNVWSKFILPKGKAKVFYSILRDKNDSSVFTILLEAVNLGPTDLVLVGPVMPTKRSRPFSRGVGWWSLKKLSKVPNGGRPLVELSDWPRKLGPGEILTVIVASTAIVESLPKKPIGFGFMDTYQRFHEIPKKGFGSLMKKIHNPTQGNNNESS